MSPRFDTFARRAGQWGILAGLLGFLAFCLSHLETVGIWLAWMDALGPRGDALFVLFYLGATLAMLSAWILEGAAGFLYGPLLGAALALSLGTLGGTGCFLLGRTVLRRWVERRVAATPRLAAIDRAVREDGLRLVILLRLSPLAPFNMISAALGATGVPVRTFVVGTAVGHVFPVLVFAITGSTVATALDLVNRPPLPPWATASVAVLTLVATFGVTRFVRRALQTLTTSE